MSDLTSKDLNWFRLANSNPPAGFYAFKERFLKRFAIQDGFDLQTIELECHRCDGTGSDYDGRCERCGGTGVWDTREHWLARYKLGDALYHKPMDHADVYHFNGAWSYPTPKNVIEGRIGHADVPVAVARRAFYRLLLRHEPVVFYQTFVARIKDRASFGRTKMVFCLIRLRNKMDLFKAVENESDLPF